MNTVQASHLRGWWMLCTAPWSFLLNNIIIRGKRGHIWRPYPSFFSWNLDCVMRNGQLACNQSLWTDRKRLSVYGIHWQLPPALNLKQMSEPQKKLSQYTPTWYEPNPSHTNPRQTVRIRSSVKHSVIPKKLDLQLASFEAVRSQLTDCLHSTSIFIRQNTSWGPEVSGGLPRTR